MTIYTAINVVSSIYGLRDLYGDGKLTQHNGIDLITDSPNKNQRFVAQQGKVVEVGWQEARGLCVLIEVIGDKRGYVTYRYQHLSQALVSNGDDLEMGRYVGVEGSSGVGTGPHCHFEVTVNGNYINPCYDADVLNVEGRYPGTNNPETGWKTADRHFSDNPGGSINPADPSTEPVTDAQIQAGHLRVNPLDGRMNRYIGGVDAAQGRLGELNGAEDAGWAALSGAYAGLVTNTRPAVDTLKNVTVPNFYTGLHREIDDVFGE